ncbi:MAG: glycosyltransferase family 4 protein [Pseudohongiella sp.]|uniref:glycosyltransferase family 4 protein n=1 Tax=Pseudohongiella sp. TaxID=1979412 RepID=UPI0034A02766
MKLLFVHQNFPGQFRFLAPALVGRGHQVVAISRKGNGGVLPGVELCHYDLARGNTAGIHVLASEWESKVLRGEACARVAEELRRRGFVPDLIIAHPGWGEALYLRDVFPQSPLICFAEFFYNAQGQEMGFDPEFPDADLHNMARLHTKNANLLLALEQMDAGISPTRWQASRHPQWAQQKIRVIHDGIDTDEMAPDPEARVTLPDYGLHLAPGDEVVTFVSRNLEPVRGYHIFMRALPEILRRRPNAVVFIVGGDSVSYGAPGTEGSYRGKYLQEVIAELDPKRVIFMGKVDYHVYRRLIQVSRCHVYLTYPFVLSWSMLEAMSAGALVVGSRTPPVTEVIEHERNGLLFDFFDIAGLTDTVTAALESPQDYASLRQQARETILQDYDLHSHCLPAQLALVESYQ